MRADAVRNRSQILAAARTLMAQAGPDLAMEEIARRAGVAVGTLYRHFPAKSDLVAAVIEDSVELLAELTETSLARAEAGASAGAELALLFRAVADRHAADRAVKAAAGRLDAVTEMTAAAPGSPVQRTTDALDGLLRRAAAAGEIRPDIEVADLAALLAGTPDDPVRRARYVEVVVAGLAARD